jgi:glycosyltransferase involved in cell wall biosynthesis
VSKLLRDARWRAAYRRLNDADGIITVSAVTRDRLVALGLTRPTSTSCRAEWTCRPRRRRGRGRHRPLHRRRAHGGEKAPILLLDAFRRAHEVHPRLRLDYVGGGPLLAAARQFVQSFRLEGAVRLHGWQSNAVARRMLAGADVFLQHSVVDDETGDEEGLPVALLEAMAAGLPIVATRHGGIPEAVEQGTTGMLVAEGDVVDMAARWCGWRWTATCGSASATPRGPARASASRGSASGRRCSRSCAPRPSGFPRPSRGAA